MISPSEAAAYQRRLHELETEAADLRAKAEQLRAALAYEVEGRDCPLACGVLGQPLCESHQALALDIGGTREGKP